MFGKKPPTGDDPRPYKERMELIYSEGRRRQEVLEAPDRELAIQARGGDMLAFEELLTRHNLHRDWPREEMEREFAAVDRLHERG